MKSVNDQVLEFYSQITIRRNVGTVTGEISVIYKNGVPIKTYSVPEDMYFFLGNNRDSSEDSRYWGFVPHSRILGKVMFIYWPLSPLVPLEEELDGISK